MTALHDIPVLAVVPARGGSKSIPRKNLCTVGGLSLIARAARVATALDWIDAAVLSTDDGEMAEEGRRHGLDVPFMRPDDHAGDLSPATGMWRHAWLASEEHFGRRFEISLLLQPTTPLRRPQDVEATVRALLAGGHAAATTVSPTPGHFAPEKALLRDADGCIRFYHDDGASHSNRQTIPPYFHRNGICYAVRRETLVDRGHIVEEDCLGVVTEGPVINIDEPLELELAEFFLARGEGGGRTVAP